MKYLLITDIPEPWREKVYENVYKKLGDEFHVVYCKRNEKRRLWTFPLGNHPKTFFKPIIIGTKNHERTFNFGVIPFLLKERPQVVICFSFNPTIFIAIIVSKMIKSKIVLLSDTWLGRDKNITRIQRIARKVVFNYFPDAFIGASKQTLKLFKYYNKNISDDRLFLSALCADNEYFLKSLDGKYIEKKYDIMFSGRIVDSKNPLFFADVAVKVKEKRGKCSALIIGDGNEILINKMFMIFEENGIDYHFPGFVEHSKLPDYYSQAKILLLPTSYDCWGVVLNEAFVCGLPVITTDMTAAAGELVIDEKNGYVLPMDSGLWAERIISLLEDPNKYEEFSKNAKATVEEFNFNKAAEGILSAIRYLDNHQYARDLKPSTKSVRE
jgi:glycosyltransferase involved in cell wall biosynthesis